MTTPFGKSLLFPNSWQGMPKKIHFMIACAFGDIVLNGFPHTDLHGVSKRPDPSPELATLEAKVSRAFSFGSIWENLPFDAGRWLHHTGIIFKVAQLEHDAVSGKKNQDR